MLFRKSVNKLLSDLSISTPSRSTRGRFFFFSCFVSSTNHLPKERWVLHPMSKRLGYLSPNIGCRPKNKAKRRQIQCYFLFYSKACFKGEIVFTRYGRQIIPQIGALCKINENNFYLPTPLLLFFFFFGKVISREVIRICINTPPPFTSPSQLLKCILRVYSPFGP